MVLLVRLLITLPVYTWYYQVELLNNFYDAKYLKLLVNFIF